MNLEFLNRFEPMCNTLVKLGWFVAPYMVNWEFNQVAELCQEIDSKGQLTDDDSEIYEKRVAMLLAETAFHPNFRAFFALRSKEVPHLGKFSHLYERGVLHYFKKDYMSCILTMLPAIEGTLLSYYGWSPNQGKKPGQDEFIGKLKTERLTINWQNGQKLFEIYGRVLSNYLGECLFKHTSKANFSLSWLNRHFVLHCMAPENINRQIDANRIILFFDLLIEYLSFHVGRHYTFIPDDNESISKRSEHYYKLLFGDITFKEATAIEESFLRENKNYSSPEIQHSLKESLGRNLKQYIDILKLVKMKKA